MSDLEQQLRNQLHDEADSLIPPPGSVETAMRKGRRRRVTTFVGSAAVAVALVGGTAIAVNLATGGSESADSTEAADSADTVDPATAAQQRDGATPPPARTGVALFDWEEGFVPGLEDGWVQSAVYTDGKFLLTAQVVNEGVIEEPQWLVWESEDGRTWTQTPVQLPVGVNDGFIVQLTVTEQGFVAVGTEFLDVVIEPDEPGPYHDPGTPVLFASADGIDWNRAELPVTTGENESWWVHSITAGDTGVLVVGAVESFPPEPVVSISKDGKTLTVDNAEWTLVVTADASGEVLYSGPADVLYGNELASGQAIWDPATNEPIVVIPWEVWEATFASPGDEVVIGHDGWVVTLHDDFDPSYSVTNASGEVIVDRASQTYLWQGPDPALELSDGTTFSITWEQYEQAQETAYEASEFRHASRPVAFVSSDLVNWTRGDLGSEPATETYIQSVAAGPQGFIAIGAEITYDDVDSFGPDRSLVWRSADGVTWDESELSDARWLSSVLAADDGFWATGDSAGGPGVFRSEDGVSWEMVFTAPRDGTGGYTWFGQLDTGPLGYAAVGSRSADGANLPDFSYSKDGKTVIVGGSDASVVIVDDDSGEVLFETEFSPFSLEPPEGIEEDGGVVRFVDGDGNVILEVTDDEFESAAADSGANEFVDDYTDVPVMFFSKDGTAWQEAALVPSGNDQFFERVVVGDDSILLLGHDFEAPRTLLYVGTPKS